MVPVRVLLLAGLALVAGCGQRTPAPEPLDSWAASAAKMMVDFDNQSKFYVMLQPYVGGMGPGFFLGGPGDRQTGKAQAAQTSYTVGLFSDLAHPGRFSRSRADILLIKVEARTGYGKPPIHSAFFVLNRLDGFFNDLPGSVKLSVDNKGATLHLSGHSQRRVWDE